ncbi:hypothetical protein CRE_00884 [Caenorhabditis remanei]|uniref:Uncharacterized protein n=1 Tax=Caenorhabditis remanei TaxID=31234 RepID=E3LEW9_CAERE|nr:hypothetical protein CRE_00884 [Caenorhabditis remanei]
MHNQNQRIQLNLHKYKTAGVQQFSIDKSSDEEFDDQSSLSSISEDDFSDSESGSYQDTTLSTNPSEATTDEMLWGRYVTEYKFPSSFLSNHAPVAGSLCYFKQ